MKLDHSASVMSANLSLQACPSGTDIIKTKCAWLMTGHSAQVKIAYYSRPDLLSMGWRSIKYGRGTVYPRAQHIRVSRPLCTGHVCVFFPA